ncbi:hypothetical protein MYOV003v1_p0032 [Vibrio phage 207E48.1]|nr:hypothetical protein MYOV003v1_p0032 [Vibrio phage 207E48.1]
MLRLWYNLVALYVYVASLFNMRYLVRIEDKEGFNHMYVAAGDACYTNSPSDAMVFESRKQAHRIRDFYQAMCPHETVEVVKIVDV